MRLTEKEIDTIIYLSSSKKPINIKELQSQVWDHKSNLETHTVETHIHRLRKKIKDKFGDENFIISSKSGYLIEWEKKIRLLKIYSQENIKLELLNLKKEREVLKEKKELKSSPNLLNNFWSHFCSTF